MINLHKHLPNQPNDWSKTIIDELKSWNGHVHIPSKRIKVDISYVDLLLKQCLRSKNLVFIQILTKEGKLQVINSFIRISYFKIYCFLVYKKHCFLTFGQQQNPDIARKAKEHCSSWLNLFSWRVSFNIHWPQSLRYCPFSVLSLPFYHDHLQTLYHWKQDMQRT